MFISYSLITKAKIECLGNDSCFLQLCKDPQRKLMRSVFRNHDAPIDMRDIICILLVKELLQCHNSVGFGV